MSKSQSLSAGSNESHGLKPGYENSLVLLLYAVFTMAMTYPAMLYLRTRVMGGPGDQFQFLWELWYVAHALFDLHKSPFFDPDVFVPFGFSLIRNQDLSPGTVLLFSPLTHFFGEVFTYNFLILVSFPLTAFGAYLLARELWSDRLATLTAGIIVGFCPYRLMHATGHLSIVSTEWIPFFLLYLERLISKPRLKSAVLFFVQKIYPLVSEHLRDAKFYIIGDKAPPEIAASATEKIVVAGLQTDVRPLF